MAQAYAAMTRSEAVAALEELQSALRSSSAAPSVYAAPLAALNRLLSNLPLQSDLEQPHICADQFADYAPVGCALLDSAGRIVAINDAGAALLGVERVFLAGQPFAHYVASDDHERFGRHLALCCQTTEPLSVEVSLCAANGTLMRVLLTSHAISRLGLGACCAVAITDITVRVWAEETLRVGEARYRAVSDLIADFAFAAGVGPDGQLTALWQAGRFFCEIGYRFDEVIRPDVWPRVIHSDDLPALRHSLAALLAGETRIDELRLVTARGKVRWVRLHARPQWDTARRRVVEIVGALKDITPYKEAGETIRFQSRLLDAVDQMVVGTTLDGTICYWNHAAERCFGWTAADAIGQPVTTLVVAAGSSAEFLEVITNVRGGQSWFGEIEARRRDDSPFPCLLTISPIAAAAEITGFIAVGSDITARKQMEQGLLETQKLESLGVLAGGIAHDFNNLLAIILGHTNLALLELPPGGAVRQMIAPIEHAARRGIELTRQMLAYAGKGRLVVEPLDLNELLRDTMILLEASVGKSVRLHYQLAPHLPLLVADASQIRQVLMNLVINASEAIGDAEGFVTMTTALQTIDAEDLSGFRFGNHLPPGDYVALEVTDTGCGMDEAMLARIFDPFFTTKVTGRGLGLAVVQGIVRRHHGALRVASAPERGATFTLLLPGAGPASSVAPGVADPAVEWRGSGSILIVDDEAGVQVLLTRMLERMGFQALTSSDGATGVELLRAHADQIVCVLLDLTMPQMSGEKTLQLMRQIKPALPVVIMSGYNPDEAARRFDDTAAIVVMPKPFTMDLLKRTLRQALERPHSP